MHRCLHQTWESDDLFYAWGESSDSSAWWQFCSCFVHQCHCMAADSSFACMCVPVWRSCLVAVSQVSLWFCRPQAMCSATLLAACAYLSCCLCLNTAPAGQAGSSSVTGKTSASRRPCRNHCHPGLGSAAIAMECCQGKVQRPGLLVVCACKTRLRSRPLRHL